MKDYGVVTVKKLWTKKRILNTLIAIFFALFIIIAIITYYGQNVGCFTISVTQKATDYAIYISDDEFESWSPRLICEPMKASSPTVQPIIKSNYVRNNRGTYKSNDKTYIGYTFWLKNMSSTETVNVKAKLTIAKATKGLENCSWVWFFDEEDENSTGTIYQRKEELTDEQIASRPDRYTGYQSTTQYEGDDVFDKTYTNLQPGEVRKFTIILWTDSEDPDCTDDILNGQINYNLVFMLESEDE